MPYGCNFCCWSQQQNHAVPPSFFTVSTDFFLMWILATSVYDFFFFSLLRTFTFSVKWSTFRLALTHPNCQNHYSCPSGPLLSLKKKKVTWIQALRYLDSWSDNWDSRWVTGEWDMYQSKGWFSSHVGQVRTAWDFISLLRMTFSLNLRTRLFLKFSI